MSAFLDDLQAVFDDVTSIEPALGKVTREEVKRVERRLKSLMNRDDGFDSLEGEDLQRAFAMQIVLYSRTAAIAIAADDKLAADLWFEAGEKFAEGSAIADQLRDGQRDPERFRKLVHGRWLIAHDQERAARKLWAELVKANAKDAIAAAAKAEQKASRPLKGAMPTLWTLNGIGVGFAGSRDRSSDGSYITTHCFKVLYIPVIAIAAYRVVAAGENNYYIIAREQLSSFARMARWALAALVVFGIGFNIITDYLNDPARLAKQRWDESMEKVALQKPEDALRELDERVKHDRYLVGSDRVQKAGADIVKLAAGLVPKPLTKEHVDQAVRVVRRFEALPPEAKYGAAHAAMLSTIDRWVGELDTADARLELLTAAETIADGEKRDQIAAQIAKTRLASADAKVETAPLDALAIYVERPNQEAMAHANKAVEQLVASPALLLDAGHDLDTWMKEVGTTQLAATADEKREAAKAAKAVALAEKVTPKQLDAELKKNPWNQWAALALANVDIEKGKLEPAYNRLHAIGKPGAMTRDVRQSLGQLASALGKLDEADELLSGLLGARLARFTKVATQLEETAKQQEETLIGKLRANDIPYDMQVKLQRATDEQQREMIRTWMAEQMESNTALKALREQYMALGDVVPASLAAGTVKLRRAQAMSGAARDAMLGEAERLFLAIRTEAEGQPEFRIGLGEVYARLGKTKESEEQFKGVLDMHDATLSLRVARVYRGIGSMERATAVAKQVFDTSTSPIKDSAAVLLGIMADTRGTEEEAEGWFKKANQSDPFVKTSLLDIEARRMLRAGKLSECAAKYAQIAKTHLQNASSLDLASYNNAAIAHQNRFSCSGDPAALADAEKAMEKAYRLRGDEPIVVGNFADLLEDNGHRRVLAKHVDMRVLHAGSRDMEALFDKLLDSDERDTVLAELDADPSIRRSIELFKQYEVLAPNSTTAYDKLVSHAWDHRDEAALAGILERAKRAKGLDRSDIAQQRERFAKGEHDTMLQETASTMIGRIDDALAKSHADAHTRAAALFVKGTVRVRAAVYVNDREALARGRKEMQEAGKLWPAITPTQTIAATLIDEAGLEVDSTAWIALRRTRTAPAALAKLVKDASPLAQKIRASKPWGEVRAVAQADAGRPSVDDLRIARLLGDSALETRAKPVLDDKLARLSYEISLVIDPTSEAVKDDLAVLDQR